MLPLAAWAVGRCEVRPSSWKQGDPLLGGTGEKFVFLEIWDWRQGAGCEDILVEVGVGWVGLANSAVVLLVQHWRGNRQTDRHTASFMLSRWGSRVGGPWLGAQTLALGGAGMEASWCWGLGGN